MLSDIVPAHRVSAADFVRSFGIWRERASETPVTITNHGRDTHVLLSSRAFAEISSDARLPQQSDSAYSSMNALFDRFRDGVVIVDQDLIVRRANAAACDFFKLSSTELQGAPLDRAIPKLKESFALRNIARTLSFGERSATDVPSVTKPGIWLHMETFPVDEGAAIFFRDITGDVEANRSADVKQAIIEAVGVDGRLGHARISPREMIEGVDRVLCDLLGLSEDAMRRVKFSTIVVPRNRVAFHDALETVFRHEGPARIDTCLFANSGLELPVRLSIVELRGEYATEGAVIAVMLLDQQRH
ncbi:PAS domain S-box protein [Sphingomonas sp. RB3P16]|uniref:PAS domain S-box protein n=1 Tax=Parasphingomonas frigoris TaxID=3096163 RepID=UPI002FC7EB92